jgi:hypothetical protein
MSENWLQSWLDGLNLAEYLDTLTKHGYTSPKNLSSILERERLKTIGVTKMGHLNRLFRAIEKLRSDREGVQDGHPGSLSLENRDSTMPNSTARKLNCRGNKPRLQQREGGKEREREGGGREGSYFDSIAAVCTVRLGGYYWYLGLCT